MRDKEEAPAGGTSVQRVRRAAQSSRGQTMIEFAYSIPVLLLLIFGLIDFSRAATTPPLYSGPPRRARSATIDPANVMQAIESKLVGLQANRANIVVTPSADGSEMTCSDLPVRVRHADHRPVGAEGADERLSQHDRTAAADRAVLADLSKYRQRKRAIHTGKF